MILGGERELVLLTLIVSGALAITGQNLVAFSVAAALWFGSIGVFRAMAKSDAQMSKVYLRQLKFRGYYPARSRPYRDAEKPRRWFYVALGVLALALAFWLA